MIASLVAEHISVVGESKWFRPSPELALVNVLVFDADSSKGDELLGRPSPTHVRLVATLRRPSAARLHELVKTGVAAILLIDELTPEAFVHTVRATVNGRTSLPHAMLLKLLDHTAVTPNGTAAMLTGREREVLQMLAEGAETRSIASCLCYSERTVKNVVHDILTKLNCRTRAQAVAVAVRGSII
jgi:DNA-binding NarL/FixJ family response regulator